MSGPMSARGGYRLTRKGLFMVWRMNEGVHYELADAQAGEAYLERDANDEPVGEYAAAFIAKHPLEAVK